MPIIGCYVIVKNIGYGMYMIQPQNMKQFIHLRITYHSTIVESSFGTYGIPCGKNVIEKLLGMTVIGSLLILILSPISTLLLSTFKFAELFLLKRCCCSC